MSLYRTKSLNTIPEKKIEEKIAAANQETDPKKKLLKLDLINKYVDSNIPLEYWNLKMERDFHGDPNLLGFYSSYIEDIKKSYSDGKGYVLAGAHGLGKMLDLETDLLTPNGFIKLSELKEGDQLFDENGDVCNVIKLHPIDLTPESYKLTFDDGSTINACKDHLWRTWTRKERYNFQKKNGKACQPTVRSTYELFLTQKVETNNVSNHSIECTAPIKMNKKTLSIDPYILGCWLGDGDSCAGVITTMDSEILNEFYTLGYQGYKIKKNVISKASRYKMDTIESDNYGKQSRLTKELKYLKLINNKHIPEEYLLSSYEDRLSLLQGLLDTDGSCDKYGSIEFCTVLPDLAKQVLFLVNSLGIKANIIQNKSFLKGKRCKDRYRISFTTKLPVFRLTRKLSNLRMVKQQETRTTHRFITKIEKIDPIPMRCITVDSPSHLFLASKSLIPTHNTMCLTSILKKSVAHGFTALYTTLSDIVSVLTIGPIDEKFCARSELIKVDFLVIDEWDNRFMANDTAADLYARILESVIRTRAQNKMPTLFATNSPNIIQAFNGALKDALSSIKNGYMIQVPVFGEDYRGKNGK